MSGEDGVKEKEEGGDEEKVVEGRQQPKKKSKINEQGEEVGHGQDAVLLSTGTAAFQEYPRFFSYVLCSSFRSSSSQP
jgi:hypothetical protein